MNKLTAKRIFRFDYCGYRPQSILFLFVMLFLGPVTSSLSQTNRSFDGQPWNISSGNLSVGFIQASPIGAYPRTNILEAPPIVESQRRLKELGLVANEDYIAWGAIERSPNQWFWQQHDAMEKTLHQAGLKYVVYNWAHFPPLWLREQVGQRTLMRCLEHNKEAYYLSIFDPRTIQWYDHFYKNLHDHFGSRIDAVYACILGPYGEGNYPLMVDAYINMGHCHEGYWCGDDFAIKAFQSAMKRKYQRLSKLNQNWGSSYQSFDEVLPPKEINNEKFKPSPGAFPTPQDKRRWLDFITWYHQSLIDFAEQSLKTVLKYFPPEKVRMKPGGNYGSVNPLPWGTYCPGYAKMAGRYKKVVLQPADCQGAIFGDKWVGSAYQFYGVKESTEPANGLDENNFIRRMFSDASSGASEFFTYEFEQHSASIQKYIHLFTGKAGDTEIALLCPTTIYRLGVNLYPTIVASYPLRDLCEYDVLDELLIADNALTKKRYKVLVIFQGDIIDEPILKKMDKFLRAGGKIIVAGDMQIKNVEGRLWSSSHRLTRIASLNKESWTKELAGHLANLKGMEGQLDGLWSCQRGSQIFVFNSTDKPVVSKLLGKTVPPFTISTN